VVDIRLSGVRDGDSDVWCRFRDGVSDSGTSVSESFRLALVEPPGEVMTLPDEARRLSSMGQMVMPSHRAKIIVHKATLNMRLMDCVRATGGSWANGLSVHSGDPKVIY